MTNTTEKNHAISNASAWMESIVAMVKALHDAENADDGDQSIDQARDAIIESPLSVEVRSPWYSLGNSNPQPTEFCILLSTGGPALRIIGDLDDYGQPTACQMEYQDWGTPWTEYNATSDEIEVMLEFCQQFYFGE